MKALPALLTFSFFSFLTISVPPGASQVPASIEGFEEQCSYFVTSNWGCSYPGMFSAQISPPEGRISISPLSRQFLGISQISVHDNLDCGTPALCSFSFSPPLIGIHSLPPAFFECAGNADPFYLEICWLEKEEAVY